MYRRKQDVCLGVRSQPRHACVTELGAAALTDARTLRSRLHTAPAPAAAAPAVEGEEDVKPMEEMGKQTGHVRKDTKRQI